MFYGVRRISRHLQWPWHYRGSSYTRLGPCQLTAQPSCTHTHTYTLLLCACDHVLCQRAQGLQCAFPEGTTQVQCSKQAEAPSMCQPLAQPPEHVHKGQAHGCAVRPQLRGSHSLASRLWLPAMNKTAMIQAVATSRRLR